MFYIFVDTQAFEREAFGFRDSTGLNALANAVTDGLVVVLLTDITDREVKRHIDERVRKALTAVKKQFVLQILSCVDFDAWRRLEPEAAAQDALQQWEAYKRDTAATMVPIDAVKPSTIMDAFFAQRAPFSADKPNEFRDAFVLEALRTWAAREQQQIIVVSGDGDHRRSCDGEVLVHAETIVEALARTHDDEAMIAAARASLVEQTAVLATGLQEALAELPTTIEEDLDADIEAVRVTEVVLEADDFELVEVRGGKALASGPATAKIEVDATIADYNNGSRDEGDWAFLPYNSVTYVTELDVRLSVRIPFTSAPLTMQEPENVTVDEPRTLDLSSDDCEVRMRQHWADDGDREESETAPSAAPAAPGTPLVPTTTTPIVQSGSSTAPQRGPNHPPTPQNANTPATQPDSASPSLAPDSQSTSTSAAAPSEPPGS